MWVVLSRINARKLVLSYLYEQCFFSKLKNNENVLKESLFADNVFVSDNELFDEEKQKFLDEISVYFNRDLDLDVEYFLKYFFDKWDVKDVDMEYVFAILKNYSKYMDEIEESVNEFTETFKFVDMSIMTQCVFWIAYTEKKEIWTENKILINEMIELAKRYDEPGAKNLVNAILHKIFA